MVNKSGRYPQVMSQHATLAQAQRSTWSTTDPLDFDKGVPFSELTLQTQPAPYEYANDGQRPSWRRSGRSRGRCGSAGEDLPWPARLTAKLAEFEAAGLALQEAHGHLRRAETDEAAALDSSGSDADDKIAVAIRNRGIYSSRVANREAARARLLGELSEAVKLGQSELAAAVSSELARRREILLERIRVAGQLEGQVWAEAIDSVLESSRPIGDVQRLEVPAQALLVDGAEIKVGLAKRLLAGFEAIAEKVKEFI